MPNPAANHTKTGLIYFNTDPSVIRVIRGSCFTASPKSVIFTLAYIIKVIVERRLTAEVVRRRRAEKRVRELHHELLRSQENERHRIALDLHDSVIQELSAVPLEYEALFGYDKRMSHRAVAKSEELNDILRNLVRSLRSLVYGLRPPALDQLGLVSSVKGLCEDFIKETGIAVTLLCAGMDRVNPDYEVSIHIYRIIQEALNNIRKHAEADHVFVRMIPSHPHIILKIQDNGRGFDADEVLDEKRIRGMKERVRFIDGHISIESSPGNGTEIHIRLNFKL